MVYDLRSIVLSALQEIDFELNDVDVLSCFVGEINYAEQLQLSKQNGPIKWISSSVPIKNQDYSVRVLTRYNNNEKAAQRLIIEGPNDKFVCTYIRGNPYFLLRDNGIIFEEKAPVTSIQNKLKDIYKKSQHPH
jgi:hypothetical protein